MIILSRVLSVCVKFIAYGYFVSSKLSTILNLEVFVSIESYAIFHSVTYRQCDCATEKKQRLTIFLFSQTWLFFYPFKRNTYEWHTFPQRLISFRPRDLKFIFSNWNFFLYIRTKTYQFEYLTVDIARSRNFIICEPLQKYYNF